MQKENGARISGREGAMKGRIRVGCGAGYAGDRWEPALELAERGAIDYLAFECLAERTIAREQLARRADPGSGYNPLLAHRIRAVLAACKRRGVRIISNMGAANPRRAGEAVLDLAREEGLADVSVAALEGDDVLEVVRAMPELLLMESGAPLESLLPRLASANAYLGADAIAEALATGADVIITGRVADPSLFLAPMLFEFGWSYDDYGRLAQGTIAGHLLECAGQVTGGYFADPGKKDVPGLARLGFPFAEVSGVGEVVIGKPAGSGGRIDRMTCAEQLLYEMHDPADYITPDCILDVPDVTFAEVAPDWVRVEGARARPRTSTYKVSIGYLDGYVGEGQMSYGGPNAIARVRLAGEVVCERLRLRGFAYDEMRIELIGMESLHGPASDRPEPYEVRLRVAGRCRERPAAEAVGEEVETLLTNGPAGGAGDFKQVREILAVQSVLLPRQLVRPRAGVVGRS
jgi:hypothetical protein